MRGGLGYQKAEVAGLGGEVHARRSPTRQSTAAGRAAAMERVAEFFGACEVIEEE